MSAPALYGRALRLDLLTAETMMACRNAIDAQAAPTTLTFIGLLTPPDRFSEEGGAA